MSKIIFNNYSNENFTLRDLNGYFIIYQKNNFNIIFECQLSKIRKFLIKRSIKHKFSKIVFLNNLIRDSGINTKKVQEKIISFTKWSRFSTI